MVQPTQLLQNFGVVGRLIQHPLVRRLGTIELQDNVRILHGHTKSQTIAYIFLLLMNMSDLEPDVLLGKGPRGRIDNVFKTLKISSVKIYRQYV